jgi:hypothetical protein
MDTEPAKHWTAHELDELVAFFAWMDALCSEAIRQGLKAPWPISDYMAKDLNYWIVDFGIGLTPAQALGNYYSSDSSAAAQA